MLWLTYHARDNPHLPCDTILEQDEWQSLYCHFQGFPLAEEPPSIKQAITWIARLGGFLARNHDGFPGVKTLVLRTTKITRSCFNLEVAAFVSEPGFVDLWVKHS